MMPAPPVAGVIGWPVAHSKSPLIHRFWLNKLAIDGDYSRFPVHPDRLFQAVRSLPLLGIRGVNVTIPHKELVHAAVDHVAESATSAGAINTIVVDEGGGLTGHNTDVDGIADALAGQQLAGAAVCIIGAGGAARAAMHVLKSASVAEVAIIARTPARGQALLDRFGMKGRSHGFEDSVTALAGRTIVINASPMGMDGQMEMPAGILDALSASEERKLAFDMVYAPLETQFLKTARSAGFATADGLVMLIGQAATAFEFFYGKSPARRDDAELRAMLIS